MFGRKKKPTVLPVILDTMLQSFQWRDVRDTESWHITWQVMQIIASVFMVPEIKNPATTAAV